MLTAPMGLLEAAHITASTAHFFFGGEEVFPIIKKTVVLPQVKKFPDTVKAHRNRKEKKR